ncbi:MAG: tRNA lysidine(34) synthetase TilS [Oscillatoriales cyanobacterium CG2_30_44_21]|nr:MAG: tRNA lysidine(34) synthetase TilS [Oscillatoriales cyanobacterium CG2_30_44_21]
MQQIKPLKIKLNRALRSHPQMIPRGSNLLVAVSGGQDSLCLASLLLGQRDKLNLKLTIAHCDHRWRKDSQANAEYVAELAQNWQLNFSLRTAEVPLLNESDARKWRYAMLIKMAEICGCDRIVTGHTRSDRVETLLYNLTRGSGADGLAALHWMRSLTPEIKLVRPLLDVSRQETAAFCRENQVKVWEDNTNQDLNYQRNRLRLEVIPYLENHFNPQLETAIAQTADLLYEDVIYLETQASRFFEDSSFVVWCNQLPRLHRKKLQEYPLALQRRIVRQFLSKYLLHQVSFFDIEKFLSLLTAQNRSQCSPFTGNVIAAVDHPWIVLHIH